MRSFFRKLGWLLRRGRREEDLQAELRFHLEETARNTAWKAPYPKTPSGPRGENGGVWPPSRKITA
jgi:hypothetical protein